MLFHTTLSNTPNPDLLKACHTNLRDALFFDIETTGFAAAYSHVYLIGAAAYDADKNRFILRQWLDETGRQEAEILSQFMDFAQCYGTLVNYNATSFDLPYLKTAAARLNLTYRLQHHQNLDLYRLIRPFSQLLCLTHCKLKDIEHFLGIARDDTYTGGELIEVYREYLKNPNETARDRLLLHNADDIRGLCDILPILAYPLLFEGHYQSSEIRLLADTAHLTLTCTHPLPKRIRCGQNQILFKAYQNAAELEIPLLRGELKYFYPNYRDYYYLPLEDTAIHKSVASYVDRQYRVPAKAATCYTKKSGLFLPQPEPVIEPVFQLEHSDRTGYFEATPKHLNDAAAMQRYTACLLRHLLHLVNAK